MAEAKVALHVGGRGRFDDAGGEGGVSFADEVVGEEGEGDGGVEDGEGGEGDFDGAAGELFCFRCRGDGTDDAGGLDDEFAAETGGDGEDFFDELEDAFGVAEVDEEDAAVVAVALYPAADGDGLVYPVFVNVAGKMASHRGAGILSLGDGCDGRALLDSLFGEGDVFGGLFDSGPGVAGAFGGDGGGAAADEGGRGSGLWRRR